MDLKEFLSEFGDSLREKINLCPVFDPGRLDAWDTEALQKIQTILQHRKQIPSQANAILALAKGFSRVGKQALTLVGEMGTGKVRRFGA